MAKDFNDAVMTNGGAALLTKAQAGECNIEFTRMAIGNGTYTDAEKEPEALKQMTNLKSLKNSYNPSGVVIHNDTAVRISARLTNYDSSSKTSLVNESYYINEIGLFAKEKDGSDSTEVLYSIATVVSEPGDEMPAYNGDNPVQIVQEYYATVDNSATVTIEILEGAYALEEDVEAEFARFETLIGACVKTADIVDDLTSTSADMPLSANQGRALKALIDDLEAENASLKEQITQLNDDLNGINSDWELPITRIPDDGTWSDIRDYVDAMPTYKMKVVYCVPAIPAETEGNRYWLLFKGSSNIALLVSPGRDKFIMTHKTSGNWSSWWTTIDTTRIS